MSLTRCHLDDSRPDTGVVDPYCDFLHKNLEKLILHIERNTLGGDLP